MVSPAQGVHLASAGHQAGMKGPGEVGSPRHRLDLGPDAGRGPGQSRHLVIMWDPDVDPKMDPSHYWGMATKQNTEYGYRL